MRRRNPLSVIVGGSVPSYCEGRIPLTSAKRDVCSSLTRKRNKDSEHGAYLFRKPDQPLSPGDGAAGSPAFACPGERRGQQYQIPLVRAFVLHVEGCGRGAGLRDVRQPPRWPFLCHEKWRQGGRLGERGLLRARWQMPALRLSNPPGGDWRAVRAVRPAPAGAGRARDVRGDV